jgi:hypothetical protein
MKVRYAVGMLRVSFHTDFAVNESDDFLDKIREVDGVSLVEVQRYVFSVQLGLLFNPDMVLYKCIDVLENNFEDVDIQKLDGDNLLDILRRYFPQEGNIDLSELDPNLFLDS